MENLVVSVAEAMKMTRLGMTKVYELINDGKLQTVKVGRRRLVKVDSIKRLLNVE
jgi:excisionase family DNA binding protein